MNPFTGSLNRSGFLVWSVVLIVYVASFGTLIDATKAHHLGVYWLALRILWGVILIALSLLVFVRRLENAGLSIWLGALSLLPVAGTIFWLVLFFIPAKPPGHIVPPRAATKTAMNMLVWKVYLWVMAAITILATVTDIRHIKLVDSIDLIVTAVGLVGLFSYVYMKKVAPKSVWQVFAILAIIYHYFYSFVLDKEYGGTPAMTLGGELVTALILLPLFIALLIFSFSSKRS